MAYHFYDDQRRHLAMAESYEHLRDVAVEYFEDQQRSHGYIRWTEPDGAAREVRITPGHLAAASGAESTAAADAIPQKYRRAFAPPTPDSGRRRAAWLINLFLLLIFLYIANKVGTVFYDQYFPDGFDLF